MVSSKKKNSLSRKEAEIETEGRRIKLCVLPSSLPLFIPPESISPTKYISWFPNPFSQGTPRGSRSAPPLFLGKYLRRPSHFQKCHRSPERLVPRHGPHHLPQPHRIPSRPLDRPHHTLRDDLPITSFIYGKRSYIRRHIARNSL